MISFRSKPHNERSNLLAFTLVEVMIVVVIIGLLATMAVQTFKAVRKSSQASIISNDFRQYRDAFNRFALENGHWPAEASPGVLPPEMEDSVRGFENDSSIGGKWQWLNNTTYPAALKLAEPGAPDEILAKVDSNLDNGNLTSGSFIKDGNDYVLILEE